jgi:hypothetical protein
VKSFFSVSSLGRAQRDADDHIRGSSHDELAIASSHPRNFNHIVVVVVVVVVSH